jgi:serine/threonine-protein kinase
MARIYRAEHEGLRRHVALKVLIDGFAQDREGHERFLREARIAAAIKHPNVVNIFDVGVQDSVPYLVMELLEGEDLEAMVHAKGALSEATLVDIVVPIVAGLAAVHDAGVVHRDLKPGNIYLARGRNDEIEPKLLDFGISRAAESEQFKLTTARGLLMGTPLYMSPEAIQGGEITTLSDQYSLGVVLYECSTGFNPFAADTLAETVRRVTTGEFAPPAQHNPLLSKRMAKIIERAMSLDPNQRFIDLREMGRELLFLAGQRTRITWSLSFGEVVGRRTGATPAMVGASAGRSTPARKYSARPGENRLYANRASLAALLFGVTALIAAVIILWSSGTKDRQVVAQALKTAPSPAPQPGVGATASSQVVPVREADGLGEPPVGSAITAVEGRAAVESEDPVNRNDDEALPTSASADSSRRADPSRQADSSRQSVPKETRSPSRATSVTAPGRGRVVATAPRAPMRRAPVVEEAEPEWAPGGLPQGGNRQQRGGPAMGTNNAPIFE